MVLYGELILRQQDKKKAVQQTAGGHGGRPPAAVYTSQRVSATGLTPLYGAKRKATSQLKAYA